MAGNSQLGSWCVHDSLIALWLAPAQAKCWELSSQEKPEPVLVWGSGNAVLGEDNTEQMSQCLNATNVENAGALETCHSGAS